MSSARYVTFIILFIHFSPKRFTFVYLFIIYLIIATPCELFLVIFLDEITLLNNYEIINTNEVENS